MSHLVAITFDDEEQAAEVYERLKDIEQAGRLSLDDSAILVKDQEGKIHVKHHVARGVKVGALVGSALGLFLAGIFAPLAGIALGAAGGALVGKLAGTGIDSEFVEEVQDSLQPGSSAIFIIERQADPAVVRAALRPFHGTVYDTTLPSDAEASLRDALK